MQNFSYWLDMPYSSRPALSANISADVAIIGGGISGVAAAYHSAKQGFKTVLLEKAAAASGSAGKNGGMVVEGFSMDFLEAADRYGAEAARDSWQRTVEARKTLQALVREHRIDCGFEQPGSLYVSTTAAEADWLRKEAQARKNAGIDCQLLQPEQNLQPSPFNLQLYNPGDCLVHPAKFVRGLAAAAEQLGVKIYEGTVALQFDAHRVTTAQGIVTADKIVLAVESGMDGLLPQQGRVVNEQAIVTDPLTDAQFASLDWQTGGMFWPTGSDYINIRKIGKRLFASYHISMNPSDQEQARQQQKQLELICKYLPTLKQTELKISHCWTGLLLITERSRPYIGKQNGVYEIFGSGGNGLTNGMLAGKILAEHLAGAEIPALYKI